MMWGDYSGGWWIVMGLSMVVFWSLVIAGAMMVVNSSGTNKSQSDSPEETLKRRLAAGEIDVAQYRALRDELQGRPHGSSPAAH